MPLGESGKSLISLRMKLQAIPIKDLHLMNVFR